MTRRIFCKVLLVVVAIFGLLVLSGVLSAQGSSEDAFDRVREVQERNTGWLMAMDGVEGTAIGLGTNGRSVINVFTARQGVAGIPQELEGVPVQVVVTGKFYALVDPEARFTRPVPIGVSTGHPAITAGTIGCRVTDGTDVFALSNNHVYAATNFLDCTPSLPLWDCVVGDPVIQPGTFDSGLSPVDDIGTLFDFEPIDFSGGNNTIDAAIALSTTSLLGNATPENGYGVPRSGTVRARLLQNVKKYGRTTGLTSGYVAGVNATVDVCYDNKCTLVARFVKQIIIGPAEFSLPGDSGSLIVSNGGRNDGKAVGLLFAGSENWTIANPIRPVLERFGVTIDDSEGPPPPGNDPPIVSITSPVNDDIFDSGATIPFVGTATDTEDGDITANLVWTSSIDSMIGTGGSFFEILNDGTHTITASVTDTGGKTSSASISITVGTPTEVTVTGIELPTMQAGTSVSVTITGSGFAAGADVTFENGSGPAPTASVTSVSTTEIKATVTAKSGGPPRDRVWDVRVTNPDGSTDVLVGGFTVKP
ncbi:MAG: hypothetical protein IIB56_12765 [Planctomycetes bacterium]|nr:hypothetical protein [Planctomycetota bacterium]